MLAVKTISQREDYFDETSAKLVSSINVDYFRTGIENSASRPFSCQREVTVFTLV
jgi:hypothetical protein